MNEKDAAVIKVLAELGLKDQPQLTPEEEELLQVALDPEEMRLYNIKQIFDKS